ncbi:MULTISPECIES: XdhC/CoxI family protein [unclassified Frankia]|uniref:XdhC family protein n=1 Tax=unclassified Frankia TaxID=2632575 RepID=UPI002AD515A5|nr:MULTISPECIES: XdhC/CoxI family protein [unclassified Frankia]
MRELLADLLGWWESETPFALATVVTTSASAPRPPGAAMAVDTAGEALGSVSGGCVEGAVYDTAQRVLATGEPVLETFGFGADDAFAAGLTCGGTISVFVQRIDHVTAPDLPAVASASAAAEPVAVATVIAGPARVGARRTVWQDRAAGTTGTEGLDVTVTDDARGMLAQGQSGQRHYGPAGERCGDAVTVFVQSIAPPPRMLLFGAIDFAHAVTRIGVFLGYHVTVCDARGVFATRKRFPEAHEVVVEWPHRYLIRTAVDPSTVICVLTHDPKFDVPLLEVAVRTPAGYIGAMGSRRTHADRLARLRKAGLTEEDLARIRAPIGLDLGARTPEETAVSIAAEIIQNRRRSSGWPLSTTTGPIHK